MTETTIRGYRVLGEQKPDKQYSYDSLMLSAEASRALKDLWREAAIKGANCLNREEEFRGDTLPSDRDAALMCAGCPVFDLCEKYRKLAHPGWGVYAGHVQGRALEEIERKEREDGDS
jgi:hypothetical protein